MLRTKQMTQACIISLAALTMTACATNEGTGRVLGGVAGAAAGSQVGGGSGRTLATVGGAILGAAIGGGIGARMDADDLNRTGRALENSRTGESTAWTNPDTGYRYDVTPTNTYESASGPCREYTMLAVIEGRNETINGTACRQEDGTWR